ncbi:hypothetical protein OG936_09165 [Streptomyces sp. NBC_00846]|nr:hypothetical protein OG936_09165 [Streptomyces sp. NBC_00846]
MITLNRSAVAATATAGGQKSGVITTHGKGMDKCPGFGARGGRSQGCPV